MKLFLFICAMLVSAISAHAQSEKMVISNNGKVVGYYVSAEGNSYIVENQDIYTVPKAGHKVVTFSAEKGQGVVVRNQRRVGNINVRKGPGTTYPVIAKIEDYDGIPESYPCLGKVNGWYKLRINGKVGYARQDMVVWYGVW